MPLRRFHLRFLRNGTATLLLLNHRYLAVTCHHVLQRYRELESEVPAPYFQIAEVVLDPDNIVIDEDEQNDLAILDVSSYVAAGNIATSRFVEPARWPPSEVHADDALALAGFPGIWREAFNTGVMRFYSMSVGAGAVASVGDSHIATRFDLQSCKVQINSGKVWGSMGGMSGGPVFVWRKTPILIAELVGFIYEYNEPYDILRVRLARVLGTDGCIHR